MKPLLVLAALLIAALSLLLWLQGERSGSSSPPPARTADDFEPRPGLETASPPLVRADAATGAESAVTPLGDARIALDGDRLPVEEKLHWILRAADGGPLRGNEWHRRELVLEVLDEDGGREKRLAWSESGTRTLPADGRRRWLSTSVPGFRPSATPFVLAPGEEARVELALERERLVDVELLDSDGEPLWKEPPPSNPAPAFGLVVVQEEPEFPPWHLLRIRPEPLDPRWHDGGTWWTRATRMPQPFEQIFAKPGPIAWRLHLPEPIPVRLTLLAGDLTLQSASIPAAQNPVRFRVSPDELSASLATIVLPRPPPRYVRGEEGELVIRGGPKEPRAVRWWRVVLDADSLRMVFPVRREIRWIASPTRVWAIAGGRIAMAQIDPLPGERCEVELSEEGAELEVRLRTPDEGAPLGTLVIEPELGGVHGREGAQLELPLPRPMDRAGREWTYLVSLPPGDHRVGFLARPTRSAETILCAWQRVRLPGTRTVELDLAPPGLVRVTAAPRLEGRRVDFRTAEGSRTVLRCPPGGTPALLTLPRGRCIVEAPDALGRFARVTSFEVGSEPTDLHLDF